MSIPRVHLQSVLPGASSAAPRAQPALAPAALVAVLSVPRRQALLPVCQAAKGSAHGPAASQVYLEQEAVWPWSTLGGCWCALAYTAQQSMQLDVNRQICARAS